jgi:tRNA dimethylallyltransferase
VKPSPVALVGTTASGKSGVAMDVARTRGDVTILCVDSMCVYRHLNIGTAKPSVNDQREVPHGLLDLVEPEEEFSVAQFQGFARAAIATAQDQERIPLLVGGTGLYHRAVIDDLELPGLFPEVSATLWEEVETLGTEVLFERLEAVDPLAATRMEPTNARRIIRALEVTIGSGRPFSTFGPGLEAYPATGIRQLGIAFDREAVDQAIAHRVEAMLAEGFVEEVRALLQREQPLARTAAKATGYAQMAKYLGGECTLEEAKEDLKLATRQLARRQWAWFRRDPRIEWHPLEEIAGHLNQALEEATRSVRD